MSHSSRHYNISALLAVLTCGCISADTSVTDIQTRQRIRSAEILRQYSAEQEYIQMEGEEEEMPVLHGEMTIEDSVRLALENNVELRNMMLARTEAEGLLIQAFSEALPTVQLNAEAGAENGQSGSDGTYGLSVDVSQPLWRGGATGAGIRYARMNLANADFAVKKQINDVIFNVASKYYEIMLEKQLVIVYEEALQVAERMLTTAQSRRAHGTVSDYEVLRAKVEVANGTADLINERNNLQKAQIDIFHLMGVSQNSSVQFSSPLEYKPYTGDVGDAENTALMRRPDLAAAYASLAMAEEQLNIVRAKYSPTADAFATGSYDDDGSGWDDNWTAGLRAGFTLYDGSKRRGEYIAAKASLARANETLKQKEQDVRAETVNAVLQLKYAEELFDSQKKNTELSSEALRILESGSKHGKNMQIEVLDARAALTKAIGSYHESIYTYAAAKLNLLNVMGILEGPDSIEQ